ncbi:MAG: hypothetical protein Q7R59_00620 [bacterium]|nr:hypothetical protein [bacterium]
MKSHPLTKALAILLTITLIAPSAFLAVPQRAHAQFDIVFDPTNYIENGITAIKSTLSEMHQYTSMIANEAQWVNTFILQPLAFVMSGNLMKLMTASVLAFVVGAANGTGAPQFVQNLNGNLQRVGDMRANAFFMQFGRNVNSPFAAAITSSLRANYLQNTSSAGFFAANRCPFYSSPNANGFLAGNWSRGGTAAWFAVTTQPACNPYAFYQASQSQLASIIGSAVSARLAELNWGQGFMSWCGANDASAPVSEEEFPVAGGINPGDACTNADGTPGTIKTPGSTIKATLDKVLGGTQDKLAQMGQLANEVGAILGDVGRVLGTVQFASQILGGPGSGGLFGVGQTSATSPTSRLLQYQTSPGYLGVTQSTVLQSAAASPISTTDISSRVTQYESSWNTIRGAANSASTTVASLASFCTTAVANSPNIASAATAQASTARSAITTQIAPVLTQADIASTTIANVRAMMQRVQNDANSTASGAGGAYSADLQTLQAMPPTGPDLSNALQDAKSSNRAVAIPAGSLTVSGGSIIDRMALIATNAEALKTSVCTAQASE